MSHADAAATYLRVTMHVASTAQFDKLLRRAAYAADEHRGRARARVPLNLLDIGAGSGEVTAELAAALKLPTSAITAMEASEPLRRRLKASGYALSPGFEELRPQSFGAVSLLNVLDRCDAPRSLLQSALRMLHPNGVLLVATVLPFCAKVYEGVKGEFDAKRDPRQPLSLPAGYRCRDPPARFEMQSAAFAASVFRPLNLQVSAWTCASPWVSNPIRRERAPLRRGSLTLYNSRVARARTL